MTDEQIAEIAGRLSEAQREALKHGRCEHSVAVSPEMDPLWFFISKNTPKDFSIRLTQLGLAVRNHLENSRGTD